MVERWREIGGGVRRRSTRSSRPVPGRVGLVAMALVAVALAAAACEDKYKDATELTGRAAVLEREVEGLRASVSRLERHEPLLPAGDVAVAIDEGLVRDVIAAQLPLQVEVAPYRVRLAEADVRFRGHAMVRLRGTIASDAWLGLEAQVDAVGAFARLEVDPETSTLSGRIALDHLAIEKASGLERFVAASALAGISSRVRAAIVEKLPRVQIPVRVQQTIDLPAVTSGPVRIDGASLPLAVSVSQVAPVRGQMWIALHVEPGEMRKASAAAAGAPRGGN